MRISLALASRAPKKWNIASIITSDFDNMHLYNIFLTLFTAKYNG
jgi:hypothetical protein